MKHLSSYTPTQLKKNSSDVFNDVQRDQLVFIESKTRPEMVITTLEHYEELLANIEKVKQLTALIKAQG